MLQQRMTPAVDDHACGDGVGAMDAVAAALADTLVRRGVSDAMAALAAETGVAAFRVAFDRWVTGDDPDLHHVMTRTMGELRGLTEAR